MISAIAIIFTFSVVVFVHELGHFLVALKFGVKVDTFSLGFGPELFGFTHKGIRYRISAVPLGGYVKMKGENMEDEGSKEADAFMGQKPLKRIAILFSGAFMNFLTGMLIFAGVIYTSGIPEMINKPVIGSVTEGSPAYQAGILPGDTVKSVNGIRVRTWQELSLLISKSGSAVELYIQREDSSFSITVTPRMSEELGRPLIGITAPFKTVRYGLAESLVEGVRYTFLLCWKLLISLWLMVAGKMAAAVAGPIGIGQVITQAAGQGVSQLFQLIALISVNLGFINLFPIPILDGGHILFAVIEMIKGEPLDARKVNVANVIGLSLIVALLIFATWQDLLRIFIR
ncbi:MAG: RIP metalloprotease RseP [Elusimicrobia bacterium]|nr:RIP metalloprotease RseP [Elusimicrobiota bacterium]